MDEIVALHSAQKKDGGIGATYVLIKKTKPYIKIIKRIRECRHENLNVSYVNINEIN